MFTRSFVLKFCKCSWQQLRWYSVKMDTKTLAQRKQHYGDIFPEKLLNKKHKTPDVMYIAKEETAHMIDALLDPFLKQSPCDTVLEMNPGLGFFTRKLLDRESKFKKILLMEGMEYFMDNLQEMHSLYPEKVKVKNADLTYVWKQLYQDVMDNGTRVAELLRDIPKKPHADDPNIILFGTVGCPQFFRHLINSIVFQNSFLSLGRAEMYFVMPPHLYVHLTSNSDAGYLIYRSTSILFQILFEHRFIARLPRKDFLPIQSDYKPLKGNKLGRIFSIDPQDLYLVRIIPRRNIFDFVAPEDLPAFWYFAKQHYISRSNRIIPSLEKWIPRCGPQLIVNREQFEAAKLVYPDENVSKLPKYSTQCVTISNLDFYPNINIYTQFGDMSPGQLLTLFSIFRKFPEYNESSFLASFENSMIKTVVSAEESVDGIADDDEIPAELVSVGDKLERPHTENASPHIKSSKKTKKIKQT